MSPHDSQTIRQYDAHGHPIFVNGRWITKMLSREQKMQYKIYSYMFAFHAPSEPFCKR